MAALRPAEIHLDETTVAGYVGHRLGPDDRRKAEAHLVRCAACRKEVAQVSGIIASLPHRRRRAWIPAAAAAVVLLGVIPIIRERPDRPEVQRELPDASPAGPVAHSPVGEIAGTPALAWSAVDAASRYRATVLDDEGRIVWEITIPDTAVVLPRSIALESERSYYWKVAAEIGSDHWLSSRLTEFRIIRRSSP